MYELIFDLLVRTELAIHGGLVDVHLVAIFIEYDPEGLYLHLVDDVVLVAVDVGVDVLEIQDDVLSLRLLMLGDG